MSLSRRGVVPALLAVLVAYAGCAQLPVSGPVHVAVAEGTDSGRLPSDIDPQPPRKGDSRLDVVSGFLEAMTAWPINTGVAKEYLTHDAAHEWNPVTSTVVYSSFTPPKDDPSGVSVRLSGASRLDSAGAWRGSVADQTLRFRVVREHGDYRIANPPKGMLVPQTWFQQRFDQVSLYYFDSQAKFLVPEPVFAPVGDQLPTSLVSALLAGPPHGLSGVVRSFLPHGLTLGLSVPVSPTGVADVRLVGHPTPSALEANLLLAQLAATLRQDPEITGFRVTVNDRPLRPEGGNRVYGVDLGTQYSADGHYSTELYGVRRGRLVRGGPDAMVAAPGPLGTADHGLESVDVAPDGRSVVGVTGDGSQVVRAPVRNAHDAEVRTILTGGEDFARPAIDLQGRVWLLDRRAGRARVWCVVKGHATQVHVPGVTGQPARDLLVSGDGTRLLAAVRRPGGDRVVSTRVVSAPDGGVSRVIDALQLPPGPPGRHIGAIAWASSTRLAILYPTRPGRLYQVDIVAADGSTVGGDTLSTVLGGHVVGLAGSWDSELPTYAVLEGALVDVRSRVSRPLDSTVSHVDYAG